MPKIHHISLLCAAAAVALGTAVLPVKADELGVDFATTPIPVAGNIYVNGWAFEDINSDQVTALGTYDGGSLSNLSSSYLVGLWNCGTTTAPCAVGNPLVASATITTGALSNATQIGDWAFVSITPVALIPGTYYAIGSQGGDGDDDYVAAGDLTVNPDIKYLNDLFNNPAIAGDLIEPTSSEGLTDPSSAGFFGANLELAVPEPGSLALLGSAFAGFGFFRRRKRTKA